LELHSDKTRLIENLGGSPLETGGSGGKKPETFTFLGFAHYVGSASATALSSFGGLQRKSG
jgi:hypothetical protein